MNFCVFIDVAAQRKEKVGEMFNFAETVAVRETEKSWVYKKQCTKDDEDGHDDTDDDDDFDDDDDADDDYDDETEFVGKECEELWWESSKDDADADVAADDINADVDAVAVAADDSDDETEFVGKECEELWWESSKGGQREKVVSQVVNNDDHNEEEEEEDAKDDEDDAADDKVVNNDDHKEEEEKNKKRKIMMITMRRRKRRMMTMMRMMPLMIKSSTMMITTRRMRRKRRMMRRIMRLLMMMTVNKYHYQQCLTQSHISKDILMSCFIHTRYYTEALLKEKLAQLNRQSQNISVWNNWIARKCGPWCEAALNPQLLILHPVHCTCTNCSFQLHVTKKARFYEFDPEMFEHHNSINISTLLMYLYICICIF